MFCRKQLEQLSDMAEQFVRRGIGVAGISADEPEANSGYARGEGISIPLLTDPHLDVITAYGVLDVEDIAVNSVFLVDQKGVVRWMNLGDTISDRVSGPELLKRAEALL